MQKSAATNKCDNKYTAAWTEQFKLELDTSTMGEQFLIVHNKRYSFQSEEILKKCN
jgi:hypothetical protein